MTATLEQAVSKLDVLVVCGAGGVGKTTVSAALAMAAAADRRAIVVTIDPAKRLASAMGLGGGLAHAETEVRLPDGSTMHAAMLDMKTAWDELVDRYAPSSAVAAHLKANPLYRGLSEHFVGSQGYMAMDRLAALHDRGDFDLIVIDTPPTRSALDFLDAPKRVTDFVGGSLLKWLAKPYTAAGRFGARAFNLTASPFLKMADRLLGSQLLEDLSAFVMDFQSLYEGFKQRAETVLELMRAPGTGFVVVTTLEGAALGEAGFFVDRLVDERLHLAGVVANRVIPSRFLEPDVEAALQTAGSADPGAVAGAAGVSIPEATGALAEAAAALETLSSLARTQAQRLEQLVRRAGTPAVSVPLRTADVHDLQSLSEVAALLVPPGA
ncbi:MAG TPA: ArsA-related P-loop ATPase [Actinomycetota bacterium]|nr:ArsA-related P-loop ATPase [Actinomycetota bacterium]